MLYIQHSGQLVCECKWMHYARVWGGRERSHDSPGWFHSDILPPEVLFLFCNRRR